MRAKLSLIALTGLLIAAVALPSGSAASAKPKPKAQGTCSGTYTNATPGKLKGYDFGLLSCKGLFGKGVQVVTYSETLTASGAVSASGTTKVYGDLGTMHGTYKLAGKLVGSTATVTGAGKITGGTGAYKGAKGTTKQTCTTTDAGAHYTCSFKVSLSKL